MKYPPKIFNKISSDMFEITSHVAVEIDYKARFDGVFWRLQRFLNTYYGNLAKV